MNTAEDKRDAAFRERLFRIAKDLEQEIEDNYHMMNTGDVADMIYDRVIDLLVRSRRLSPE
jgi:NAD-dependent DNA ligase